MMSAPALAEQVFKRPDAEEVFRPWFEKAPDAIIKSMLGFGECQVLLGVLLLG